VAVGREMGCGLYEHWRVDVEHDLFGTLLGKCALGWIVLDGAAVSVSTRQVVVCKTTGTRIAKLGMR